MCTAVVSIEPGLPVLLVGVRDELTDRAWQRPRRHWPARPNLIGGLDLVAGGTWLAVAPDDRRVACVLNGRGRLAPASSRHSRGDLPLRAAAGEPLPTSGLTDFDPFHLLTARPEGVVMQSWDGERLTETELGPGLHFVVNSGLAGNTAAYDAGAYDAGAYDAGAYDGGAAASPGGQGGQAPNGRAQELARIALFRPLFAAASRPVPRPGQPVQQAWGAWLRLADGDGLDPHDPRALIVRRELGDGRAWGTTSVSLVALSAQAVRYDFTATPGDPAAWYPVLGEQTAARS